MGLNLELGVQWRPCIPTKFESVNKPEKTGSMDRLTSSTSCRLQRLQRYFREWHANLRPKPYKHRTEEYGMNVLRQQMYDLCMWLWVQLSILL